MMIIRHNFDESNEGVYYVDDKVRSPCRTLNINSAFIDEQRKELEKRIRVSAMLFYLSMIAFTVAISTRVIAANYLTGTTNTIVIIINDVLLAVILFISLYHLLHKGNMNNIKFTYEEYNIVIYQTYMKVLCHYNECIVRIDNTVYYYKKESLSGGGHIINIYNGGE
jgi:hypothetical protein